VSTTCTIMMTVTIQKIIQTTTGVAPVVTNKKQ
jgi:hypothetical protein